MGCSCKNNRKTKVQPKVATSTNNNGAKTSVTVKTFKPKGN